MGYHHLYVANPEKHRISQIENHENIWSLKKKGNDQQYFCSHDYLMDSYCILWWSPHYWSQNMIYVASQFNSMLSLNVYGTINILNMNSEPNNFDQR